MADHVQWMAELLHNRDARVMKREVAKLTLDEVKVELAVRDCSEAGPEATLRDRLLRALMRGDETLRDAVPWYEWDVAAAADQLPADMDMPEWQEPPAAIEPRKRGRPKKKSTVIVAKPGLHVRFNSASSEEDAANERIRAVESVMVHAPCNGVPVSSTATTTTTTTASITTCITTPSVVPSALGKPYTQGENSVTNSGNFPRLTINHELRRLLYVPSQWEFYSAEHFRGLRPTSAGALGLTPPPVAPAVSAANRVEVPWPMRLPGASPPGISPPGASLPNASPPCTSPPPEDEIQAAESTDGSEEDLEAFRTPLCDTPATSKFLRTAQTSSPRVSAKKEVTSSPGYARTYEQLSAREQLEEMLSANPTVTAESNHSRATLPPPARTYNDVPRANRRVERNNYSQLEERRGSRRATITRNSSSDSGAERSERKERVKRQPIRRSPCSFESEDEQGALPIRLSQREGQRFAKTQAVKMLRSWGLKFSGEDRNEDPEEFLEQLEDCVDGSEATDEEILSALPCILLKKQVVGTVP